MTKEDREFLNQIMDYANEVMGDVDPEKVRISEQLEKLRPILQKLAMVYKMPVEDVFIKYMDLATEAALEQNKKFEDDYKEILGETPKPKFYKKIMGLIYFSPISYLYFTTLTLNTPSTASNSFTISSVTGVSISNIEYATSPFDLFIISVILIPLSPNTVENLLIIPFIFLWKIATRPA